MYMQLDSRVRVSFDAVKVAGEVLPACCLMQLPYRLPVVCGPAAGGGGDPSTTSVDLKMLD